MAGLYISNLGDGGLFIQNDTSSEKQEKVGILTSKYFKFLVLTSACCPEQQLSPRLQQVLGRVKVCTYSRLLSHWHQLSTKTPSSARERTRSSHLSLYIL